MKTARLAPFLAFLAALFFPCLVFGQTDPGVRPGAINGQPTATATNPLPLSSVAANSPTGALEFFQNGLARFQELEVVSGGTNNGRDRGLTSTSVRGAIRNRRSGVRARLPIRNSR